MFAPFLKHNQTRIIWLLLEGKPLRPEDENERENLREWFEAEVQANAQARRNQTGV
jgi:hypothetical protein